MSEDIKQEVIKRFWQRMAKLVGIIPVRVVHIMDLLELSGSDALATAKDWSASVEITTRTQGTAIHDEAFKRGTTTRTKFDIFGRHETDMSKFELTDPERSMINRIALLVQQRGILAFIHDSDPTAPMSAQSLPDANRIVVPIPSIQEVRRSLIARLSTYYGTRRIGGITMRDFNDLHVEIVHQTAGKVTVKADCVVKCGMAIRCIRTGNTWGVSNYTQHIMRRHSDRNPIAQRTRSRGARRTRRTTNYTAAFQGNNEGDDSNSYSDVTYDPEHDELNEESVENEDHDEDEDEDVDEDENRDGDEDENRDGDEDEDDDEDEDSDEDENRDSGEDEDEDEDDDESDGRKTERYGDETTKQTDPTNKTDSSGETIQVEGKVPDTTPNAIPGRGRKKGPNVSSIIELFSPAASCSYRPNPEN